MQQKALYGLVSGVALVVATLIGVAVLNMPQAESASAPSPCQHGPALSDQGYGFASATGRCSSIK